MRKMLNLSIFLVERWTGYPKKEKQTQRYEWVCHLQRMDSLPLQGNLSDKKLSIWLWFTIINIPRTKPFAVLADPVNTHTHTHTKKKKKKKRKKKKNNNQTRKHWWNSYLICPTCLSAFIFDFLFLFLDLYVFPEIPISVNVSYQYCPAPPAFLGLKKVLV